MTTATLVPTKGEPPESGSGALAVLANRPFLLLWLSQAATQIGGNMVLYGLTVIVWEATHSSASVSALILTFLVPAVLLSAIAGVIVDRFDPRIVLVATNVLRGIAIGRWSWRATSSRSSTCSTSSSRRPRRSSHRLRRR